MKQQLKDLFIFLGGALLGGVVGARIVYKKFEREFKALQKPKKEPQTALPPVSSIFDGNITASIPTPTITMDDYASYVNFQDPAPSEPSDATLIPPTLFISDIYKNKVNLVYYLQDKVLFCPDNREVYYPDEIADDLEDLLNEEAFGKMADEPDMMYVKDRYDSTYYSIMAIDEPFTDDDIYHEYEPDS